MILYNKNLFYSHNNWETFRVVSPKFFVLSELGCVKKGELKGWFLTEQGRQIGGVQVEAKKLGVLFVRWHESIVEVCALVETISQVKGTASKERNTISGSKEDKGFREKFEAKLRTPDGHSVRSKAEMLIDNWLNMAEIVHAYERKLPVE